MSLTASTSNAAPADAPIAQGCSLLRLAAGGEVLAVPIDAVREILEVGRLTALPRTPDLVRGVMNLRGAVVPVIDLSARIGHGAAVIGRRSCIVVVEAAGAEADDDDGDGDAGTLDAPFIVGLLVDAVYEVFDTEASRIEAVPALGTRVRADFLAGMTRSRGQVIGLLSLAQVLAQADLAGAIAAWQPPH